jgi:hypothetical protein
MNFAHRSPVLELDDSITAEDAGLELAAVRPGKSPK